jgi:hypothetical protein
VLIVATTARALLLLASSELATTVILAYYFIIIIIIMKSSFNREDNNYCHYVIQRIAGFAIISYAILSSGRRTIILSHDHTISHTIILLREASNYASAMYGCSMITTAAPANNRVHRRPTRLL